MLFPAFPRAWNHLYSTIYKAVAIIYFSVYLSYPPGIPQGRNSFLVIC